jgi:hypothetical protein
MRFKQYLSEIEATPRQGLIHFEKMKPIEFLHLAQEIAAQDRHLRHIKTSLKVDGASARFGKDSDGKFFFETGRSGAVQTPKAFSTYTMDKGGTFEMIERALHYDEMYDILEGSDIWDDLPNNTKVICEIMFNSMAELIDDKLKFVSIKYDRHKLGNVMTIIPISVIGDYDIDKLYDKSNDDIKIISPDLGHINIKLDIDLDFVDEIDETVLTSLKHKDREKKLEYITLLQEIKDAIAKQILAMPIVGRDVLGDEIEGLVVELGGKTYKITTPVFKAEKSAEKLAYKNNK